MRLILLLALLVSLPSSAADAPKTPAELWRPTITHAPSEPRSAQPVVITARAAGDIVSITLEYQIVDPGAYVALKDAGFAKNWISLAMQAAATPDGGKSFTATLPAELQKHRRLIRYRMTGVGAGGKTLTAPGRDEPCPNFAYFVYDRVPAWAGAIDPKSKDPKLAKVETFPAEAMLRIQPYHLIAANSAIENVTWKEQTGGKEFKYTATLVAGGKVYDHVRMRARGGVWRYAMGKNMWKIDFPEGHRLQAADDFGRPYPATWSKLNLRPCISMGDYGRRGEQGMYEAVGFRLFSLAGVPACNTHWVQWRIVSEADESPADQFRGDFWGLYLAVENIDGRFLKSHGLPDGNLYKMANGTGELNNQGPGQPADKSDLNAFLGAYQSKDQPEAWWRANLDLPRYYSYRSILECIHHYDIADGKNYDYYKDPQIRRWSVFPWDLDLTWADHMYGNGDEPFRSRALAKPVLKIEYQNRLREIRDLLFNPDQAGKLIDEYAALVGPTGGVPAPVDADRRKWDFHPAMSIGGQAGQGRFYQAVPTKDFAGMVQQMKEWVKSRGKWIDQELLRDDQIPATPTATYAGPAGYPGDAIKFRASAYKGKNPLSAVRWRVAEVSTPGPKAPGIYEITPKWESADLKDPAAEIAIPKGILTPGQTYRARVRVTDAAGRASHWSDPIEFKAGAR